MSKLIDFCCCPLCKKSACIGLLVEGNAYFGDRARYLRMNKESLKNELGELTSARRCAFKAFIFHPTVPWFLACLSACLVFLILGYWHHQPAATLNAATIFSFIAFVQAVVRMNRKRQSLQDGLRFLRDEIKIVEGCLAVREVLAKEAVMSSFRGGSMDMYPGSNEPAL